MNAFWSDWVKILVVLNLVIVLVCFILSEVMRVPTQPDGTTGHVWGGGIRDGVRRLPRWWALSAIGFWVFAVGYLVLYPGFGSNKGILGWTSHGQLASDVAANDAKLDPLKKSFDSLSIPQLAATAEATRIGYRLFVDNCTACHGIKGHGTTAVGAPDLTDSDWLWGGTPDDILKTILDGRTGVMPALGGALDPKAITEVANYVLSLSGSPHSAELAAAGQSQFTMCAACHGADAKGNPMLGAPNLTYPKRLYGNSLADIEHTIKDGRTGTMPAWRQRLGEADVRLVTAWVYAQSHPAASAPAR